LDGGAAAVKVLVTGGTGFVGSHVAATLCGRGDEVHCLARRPAQTSFLSSIGARITPGSLEDRESLNAAVAQVEVVYHLAALTAAGSERELLTVNVEGTARLLAAVRAANPGLRRFVHVSSLAAVGPTERGRRLTEDSPCRPVTAYGRSKLAGEAVVRETPAMPWTIVRPSVVYGPRDLELLRMFRIVRSGFAPVFGIGRRELSLVYAEDLATAIVLAADAAVAVGQTYHLAHPPVVRTRELVREIGRAVLAGRSPLIVPVPSAIAARIVRAIGRAAATAGRRTVVSEDKLAEFLAPAWGTTVDKAERELAWRPAYDLRTGVEATAAWYRTAGLLA
jgi:nucleoside-diphosphate-sugar epimerase